MSSSNKRNGEDIVDLTVSSSSSSSSSSDISESDDDTASPSRPNKRPRLDTNDSNSNSNNDKTVDPILLQHAKKRLSKWAARLFDPDRPRGLVETPTTIPLNDECLTAFGKREKKFDQAMGRHVEVKQTIESDDDDDDDEETQMETTQTKTKAAAETKKTRAKVKVTNLAYRTTTKTLSEACEKFGPLVEIKLILDKEREGHPNVHNSGRGYITFENAEDAEACIDGLKKTNVDGRPLRLSLALAKPKSAAGAVPASARNRYWDKDISTVCYRCGGVGHIEPNCTNPAKPKPCPFCANVVGYHEQYHCPSKQICFNCGIPGHVIRDCTHRRGISRRMICGICFQPGHHRLQCRAGSYVHSSPAMEDAICMLCGKQGHFLCKELKWFYGLKGISCFNCGSQGHLGYDCRRPNLFQCLQDSDLTKQEIDRATSNSMAEQMEQQLQERGRQRDRGDSSRRKNAKSMPPQRGGGSRGEKRNSFDGESRRRSKGGGGAGGRGYDTSEGDRKRSSSSSRGYR